MDYAIQVENISKCYRLGKLRHEALLKEWLQGLFHRRKNGAQESDEFWALDGVNFEIKQGELVGIVGRNGAGKSTLLKCLSRITQPTKGRVLTRGRISSLLEVGTGFHQELSGRENIYLNGSILGMKKREIDRKLDEIISFSGVEKFIDTPIKRYSSGMKLRLGFAVAAHLDPDILLVDEVLAVGDVAFQRKCLAAMDELQSGGRTVLFVSHDLNAVENLCDRAIWIDAGKVREDGETNEVIQHYLGTFATTSDSEIDLAEMQNRQGNGDIRIVGIELLNALKEPEKLFRSGDPLTIRLHYRCHRRTKEPHFGVRFYTEHGILVTDCSTWHMGMDIPVIEPGSGFVDYEIDSLCLMPARYRLSLLCASVGHIYYDHLEQAVTLNVEPSNVYNSGRGVSARYGIMFFSCRWTLGEAQHETAGVHRDREQRDA